MRVVVTGGTGFIGSFLAEALLERGHAVRVPLHEGRKGFLEGTKGNIEWLEGDLRRDEKFCETLLEGCDQLFHLASRRKNVAFHRAHAAEVAADNIRMSLALASALSAHPVPVLFMSSATVTEPLSMVEQAGREDVDGYALGKAASEIVWLTASRQYHFPLLIPRPVGIYGPRDTFSLEGNVIPALMIKASQAKDTLEVWGSGNAERSFLYVEDVVRALLTLTDAGAEGVQYLAPRETVTIKKLAERIRDLVAPGLALRFDASKPEGSLELRFPPLHPALRDFPWTPLQEGLSRTLDWQRTRR